jgi:hypothetical protein
MHQSDFASPILIHSRMKKQYDHYRRMMRVMKMLTALCVFGALGFTIWMAGGAAALRTDGYIEVVVAVAVPLVLVVVLAVVAHLSGR